MPSTDADTIEEMSTDQFRSFFRDLRSEMETPEDWDDRGRLRHLIDRGKHMTLLTERRIRTLKQRDEETLRRKVTDNLIVDAFWDWVRGPVSDQVDLTVDRSNLRDLLCQIWSDLQVNLHSQAFGYEYGSEVGVHDPGPSVEVLWKGDGDGPSVDRLVPSRPIESKTFEYGHREKAEVVDLFLDYSQVEFSEYPVECDGRSFTFYRMKGELVFTSSPTEAEAPSLPDEEG